MEWFIDRRVDPFPTPHPCVRYPQVFELPYETLKARFEFAIRAGVKSPSAVMREKKSKTPEMTLKTLFLTDVDEYLRAIAPAIRDEEYYMFERMVEECPDEEDQTILEVVRLQTQGQETAEFERLTLKDDEETDSDDDSDEKQFHKTHKLHQQLPSGQKKIYRINFEADEVAAKKRHTERLYNLSDDQ